MREHFLKTIQAKTTRSMTTAALLSSMGQKGVVISETGCRPVRDVSVDRVRPFDHEKTLKIISFD